ncbi:MAG: hypothetical protein LBG45_03540 [Dysgonamonadaceae bacterium]|nr:hypothetical protein [Dysgonamonadaceae bacterium]
MIGKTFISLKIELLCVENYCPQDKRWGDFEHPTLSACSSSNKVNPSKYFSINLIY